MAPRPARPRPKPASTTARGLGWEHQKQRARLLERHVDGTPCGWCGQPMYRSQDLAADHTLARAHGGKRADRLLHALCNKQRGDGTRSSPLETRAERAKWTVLDWAG